MATDKLGPQRQTAVAPVQRHRHGRHPGDIGELGEGHVLEILHGHLLDHACLHQQFFTAHLEQHFQGTLLPARCSHFPNACRGHGQRRCQPEIVLLQEGIQRDHVLLPARLTFHVFMGRRRAPKGGDGQRIQLEPVVTTTGQRLHFIHLGGTLTEPDGEPVHAHLLGIHLWLGLDHLVAQVP